MLWLADGTLVLAPADLGNHLACAHLLQQQLAITRGERAKPRPADDPHAQLIRDRGDAHERNVLAMLTTERGGCVDVSSEVPPDTREALEAATAATAAAMSEGAPLIYQAQLFDGRWQGRADFLRRVPIASSLGDWSYQVLDTKLARHSKPEYVHQLSIYSRLLTPLQGLEPHLAHLVLGDGSRVTIELRRYQALHRHLVTQLEQIVGQPARETYPEPVAHCAICALAYECDAIRRADDHLSLVAGARRDQRERLRAVGLTTVRALAEAPDTTDARQITSERFARLRAQASLQLQSRTSGQPTHRHLPPARAAGYARLPPSSAGDVFFDLEGDPYLGEGGIEYLWGWCTADGAYEFIWAHDADAEKVAFERFIDRVMEIGDEYPDMHVFHYAPHELSKLRSLSTHYATREDEVDELLRGDVLVDLYAVVRQGIQVGEESYSLKKLERHHGFNRLEKRVREGGGSIVAYETWLETEDAELLEAIRAYNQEDCRSTLSLRNWLLAEMRPQAEADFGVDYDDFRSPEPEKEHLPPAWLPEVRELVQRLLAGMPAGSDHDTPDQAERRLLAHLLLYHHREGKPAWWRYFDVRGKPVEDLIDDPDALAGLVRDESSPPTPHKLSLDYRFTFPPQEFRLDAENAEDPTTGEKVNVVRIDVDHVVLRRGRNKPPPAPVALVAGAPINPRVLREALLELVECVLDHEHRYAASRAVLRREPPVLASGRLGESTDELVAAVLALKNSVLPVQGPPGTGKTFRGARMIVAALVAGRRVGITAPSHAAIQNLLRAVEEYAHSEGFTFAGVYKGSGYESPYGLVTETDSNDAVREDHQLAAGTAWLFARKEHREAFDVIFIDEAGQFALANAGGDRACRKELGASRGPAAAATGHPGRPS